MAQAWRRGVASTHWKNWSRQALTPGCARKRIPIESLDSPEDPIEPLSRAARCTNKWQFLGAYRRFLGAKTKARGADRIYGRRSQFVRRSQSVLRIKRFYNRRMDETELVHKLCRRLAYAYRQYCREECRIRHFVRHRYKHALIVAARRLEKERSRIKRDSVFVRHPIVTEEDPDEVDYYESYVYDDRDDRWNRWDWDDDNYDYWDNDYYYMLGCSCGWCL